VELGPIELAPGFALVFLPPRGFEIALEISGVRVTGQALRRSELEQLVRLAAICSDLSHPGWLLGLTSRMAPIVEADGDYSIHLLEEALAVTPSFGEGSKYVIERSDARGAGIVWAQTDERWHVAQRAGYSAGTQFELRSTRDVVFPHAQLAALLATTFSWITPTVRELARRVAAGDRDARDVLADALRDDGCDRPMITGVFAGDDRTAEAWVLEFLLGLTPGAILGPMLGASSRPHAQYWRNVMISFPDSFEADRVGEVLASRGYKFDPSELDQLRPRLRGELEPALQALLALLRSARARSTSVWVDTRIIPV
jgi:hypothetical protein